MSKYLVKILSICAFVVLLPLIILGTALCVTETENYKLRLFVDGELGENAKYEVLINGELKENNEISLIKNTEVVVSFVGEGYNFDKWYEGSNTTYQSENKVASENPSFTFKMTSNLDLTAKVNVKKYSVTYTGGYIDGASFETDVYETVDYQYGEALKVIEPRDTDENIIFAGWAVVNEDSSTVTPFKNATFAENGNYEVKAIWRDLKEEVYNLNVKFNAKSNETKVITYNFVDGFTAYNQTREFYTFVGFEYKETLYSYNAETKDYLSEKISLGKVLIEENVRDVNLTAVWKAEYETITLDVSGVYKIDGVQDVKIYGKKSGDDTYHRVSHVDVLNISDINADGVTLENKIKDISVLNQFESFYYFNGTDYVEVALMDMEFVYNSESFDSHEEATLADMISLINSSDEESKFDKNQTIKVKFIFNIKN